MLEDKQILKCILAGETRLNPTWVLLEERDYLEITCTFWSMKATLRLQSRQIQQHNPAKLVSIILQI